MARLWSAVRRFLRFKSAAKCTPRGSVTSSLVIVPAGVDGLQDLPGSRESRSGSHTNTYHSQKEQQRVVRYRIEPPAHSALSRPNSLVDVSPIPRFNESKKWPQTAMPGVVVAQSASAALRSLNRADKSTPTPTPRLEQERSSLASPSAERSQEPLSHIAVSPPSIKPTRQGTRSTPDRYGHNNFKDSGGSASATNLLCVSLNENACSAYNGACTASSSSSSGD